MTARVRHCMACHLTIRLQHNHSILAGLFVSVTHDRMHTRLKVPTHLLPFVAHRNQTAPLQRVSKMDRRYFKLTHCTCCSGKEAHTAGSGRCSKDRTQTWLGTRACKRTKSFVESDRIPDHTVQLQLLHSSVRCHSTAALTL
jgi:hypothetical protein